MNISTLTTNSSSTAFNRSVTVDYVDPGQKIFFCALLIILVIACTAFLRTIENAFVVNLALADFIISFVTQPSSLVGVVLGKIWFTTHPILCKVIAQLCSASCIATHWNTLLIAINRYILIRHPTLYRRVYTQGSVFLMCLTVWVVMLGATIPNHVDVGWGSLGFSDILFVCTFATDHYHYTLFNVSVFLFFPAILTFVAYYGIYRQVRISRIRVLTGQPGKSFRKDIRIVKSLFKAYVVYLVLVAPFGVIMLINMGQLPHIWYMLSLLLYHGVGTANCFLYAVRLGKFWDGLRLMFHLPMKSESSGASGQLSTSSQRAQATASSRRSHQ